MLHRYGGKYVTKCRKLILQILVFFFKNKFTQHNLSENGIAATKNSTEEGFTFYHQNQVVNSTSTLVPHCEEKTTRAKLTSVFLLPFFCFIIGTELGK